MKPRIVIRLFDRLSVRGGDQELLQRSSRNAKELFCYLIVGRRSSVPRESLAALIAGKLSAKKSKKALRQALWHLRHGLVIHGVKCVDRVLTFGDGWVQFTPDGNVRVDILEFEQAVDRSIGTEDGRSVDTKGLRDALEVYRGGLLQGWYQEWCLEERERLRQLYLRALDALIADCEFNHEVSAGVAYAGQALHADPARECTHRALMRLYRLAGDRASAIHQYQRCKEAHREELDVEPDGETRALEREIRAGKHPVAPAVRPPVPKWGSPRRNKF